MKQIQSLEDYERISEIVDDAQDALNGDMGCGIHYDLAWILRGFGIFANSREDTVRQGKMLLKTYEKENFK